MHTGRVIVQHPVSGLIEGLAFFLGLIFGSFLNVCIARLPQDRSVVRPRSHCPVCQHPIRWYDNVPLLSWVVLRARCRDCGALISWKYPAVELLSGTWFAFSASQFAGMVVATGSQGVSFTTEEWFVPAIAALSTAMLGWLLIGLMVMDWQTQLLPNEFTFGGIAAAFFLICSQAIFLGPGEGQIVLNSAKQLRLRSPGSFAAQGNVFLTGPESLIFGRLLAVCGAALLLLLVRGIYKGIRKRDGMGAGDVKLVAMIAAFLGFWPAMVALFVGVVAAAVYSIFLLAGGRAGAATKIAFGSFLCAGGLVSAVFGARLVEWYRGLLR